MDVFRFAWWNTSLSPGGKSRENSAQRRQAALEVIGSLVDEGDISLLSLGEVAEEDVVDIIHSSKTRLRVLNHELHGIAVIYREGMFLPMDHDIMTTTYMGRSLRRCLHVQLYFEHGFGKLHVFVLHWPSDVRGNHSSMDRERLAQDLREAIEDLPESEHVIVMGDFNAEPFSREVAQQLLASRERRRARSKSLLYNPFWRKVGELQSLELECSCGPIGAGTYFYRQSGTESQWYTFDQILLSASLLDTARWHVLEDEVSIWCKPPLLDEEKGTPRLKFDHFPILGSLRSPRTGTSES